MGKGFWVVVALICALAPATASAATTITVNSSGDAAANPATECKGVAGDCSLRQALDKASAGYTVSIPASITKITLSNGVLQITKNIIVAGAGATKNTIDAAGASGIFQLPNGDTTATISGLTLTRGNAKFGAAVNDGGGSLTLKEDNFTSNVSGGNNTVGFGTVYDGSSGTSSMTIINCSFTSNTTGGGGITNGSNGLGFGILEFDPSGGGSSLNISGTSFTNNVVGGSGSNGYGPLYYSASSGTQNALSVAGSTFSGNKVGASGGAEGFGGAMYLSPTGNVSIKNSSITSNSVGGSGGLASGSGQGFGGAIDAVMHGGNFLLANSTIANDTAGGMGSSGQNSGAGFGGGLEYDGLNGPHTIVSGDTFSGNRAGGDGGTGADSGSAFGVAMDLTTTGTPISLVNTTVSGNVGGGTSGTGSVAGLGFGGGVYVESGGLAAVNDTIDGNRLTSGSFGAAGIEGGPVTLRNTIIAANTEGAAKSNCGATTPTSQGHNLTDGTATQCGLTAPGDQSGANPSLGPLKNNGGPTMTQALLGGPAVNTGTNTGCPATDQRGVKRPQAGICDIGAYEVAKPQAITGPATKISQTKATVHGSASNADVGAGSAYFQYGKTTAYGKTTPHKPLGAGLSGAPIAAQLSGLKPGTTYHYRLVVTNLDGTTKGADKSFKSAKPKPKLSGLKVKPSKFSAKHGTTVTFKDSATGGVTITIVRKSTGKKVRSFKHTAKRGANHFHLDTHKLKAGKYRLSASAKNGNHLSASFTIS